MSLSIAQECLDGVYNSELAIDALYISQPDLPSGGEACEITLLADQGEGQYQALGLDLAADRNVFTLRRSQIDPCRRGDHIQMPYPDGPTYIINTNPRLYDVEKLEWMIELVEQTP